MAAAASRLAREKAATQRKLIADARKQLTEILEHQEVEEEIPFEEEEKPVRKRPNRRRKAQRLRAARQLERAMNAGRALHVWDRLLEDDNE